MNPLALTTLRLPARLSVAFGSQTLITLMVGALAWWGALRIETALRQTQADNENALAAMEISDDINRLYLHMGNLVAAKDAQARVVHQEGIQKYRDSYRGRAEQLKARLQDPDSLAKLAAISEAIAKARSTNQRLVDLITAGSVEQALELYGGEAVGFKTGIDTALRSFIQGQKDQVGIAVADTESMVGRLGGVLLATLVSIVVMALVFSILITRSITRPLAVCISQLDRIGQGDLTQEVPQAMVNRPDEAGDLARALRSTNGNLRSMALDLGRHADTLAEGAGTLSSVAQQVSGGARQTSAKAESVSAAAEEMSVSAGSVAAGMEEATTNLTTVAGATEELTSTISEIATHSEKARVITHDATQQAGRVTELVRQLSDSAQDIGKVTETITGISDQTKLLALNATIEAARAGSAGKGFAVVANEIKELARQTSEATEDIKSKIGAIQSSTSSTLGDMEGISKVIRQMTEIVNTIATAIEEQSSVVKDVARNVGEAASGVRDANERVSQMATVSQSVAGDIALVNQAAGEMAAGSEQAQTHTDELTQLADQIRRMVARFQVGDPSASTHGSGSVTGSESQDKLSAGHFEPGKYPEQEAEVGMEMEATELAAAERR